MTVQQWKQEYRALKDYAASHPEITIDPGEISIPQQFKEAFYQRFDAVRRLVVAERCASMPVDVDTLSHNYLQVEKEIRECLCLENIQLPVDLSSFLSDPKEGLTRVLYNRLFDLMQGKTTEEEFEKTADSELSAAASDLYRIGYEPWAALAIIRAFEPDKAYRIDLDEDSRPILNGLNEIAFGRQFHHPAVRIPEFVIHSGRLDKHIAVKMPLAREVETFYIPYEPPVKPKKRTGDTSFVIGSRTMFLSIIENLGEIPIFADIHKRTIKSPDLTIEFLTARELADPDAVARVQYRIGIMKPRLGAFLAVMDCAEGADLRNPAESIEVIAVGFDVARLQPVLDKFA